MVCSAGLLLLMWELLMAISSLPTHATYLISESSKKVTVGESVDDKIIDPVLGCEGILLFTNSITSKLSSQYTTYLIPESSKNVPGHNSVEEEVAVNLSVVDNSCSLLVEIQLYLMYESSKYVFSSEL